MSKLVFRNEDRKAIKLLLKEIGEERFLAAMEDCGMTDKPLTMEGFYVDYIPKEDDFVLYYMYPSRTVFKIMSVLGYWAIPEVYTMKRIDV